jgi:hypothetical protein
MMELAVPLGFAAPGGRGPVPIGKGSAMIIHSLRYFALLGAIGVALIAQSSRAAAGDNPVRSAAPDARHLGRLYQLEKQAAETCADADSRIDGTCDSILQFLFEFQKDLSLEARAASDLRRAEMQRKLEAKEGGLENDQRALDNQRRESEQRSNAAMDAAAPGASDKGGVVRPCHPPDVKCPDSCKLKPCP